MSRELPVENVTVASRPGIMALILLLGVVGMWRMHLWERVPGFAPDGDAEYLFTSESALQFRYARMIATGVSLPAIDRQIQYPEGVNVARDIAVGMEYVEALPYRLLGLQMPFHRYLALVSVMVSLMAIVVCYAASAVLWRGALPGVLSAALYSAHFVSYGRTIGSYSREHFALPFIFAGFLLFGCLTEAALSERRRRWCSHSAGICWGVALSTWHFSRFVFLLALGYLLLMVLLGRDRKGKEIAVVMGWCIVASLLHPMLRARGFVFSGPMLLGIVLAISALLPDTVARRRLLTVAGAVVAFLVGSLLLTGGDFSHVSDLLIAKLTHPLGRPADPAAIPIAARMLWVEAFLSPNVFVLLYGYMPILGMGICGLLLLVKDLRLRKSGVWLLYGFVVFAVCFILVNRLGVFVSFFAAVLSGRLLVVEAMLPVMRYRQRLLMVVAMFIILLSCEGYKSYHYRTAGDAYAALVRKVAPPLRTSHLPGGGYEMDRLMRWIRRETPADAAIAADYAISPTIMLKTNRSILLQPKWETALILGKLKTWYQSLYAGEEQFYLWCLKYKADYVLVSPESILFEGPGFPAWIAGHARVPRTSAAWLLHFSPGLLKRFALVYQNSRFRLYRVLTPDAKKFRQKEFAYQPLYDAAYFGIMEESPVSRKTVEQGIGRLLMAEDMLRQGKYFYSKGNLVGARNVFVQALSLHPGLPEARTIAALMALRVGKPDAAVINARKAVACEPDVAVAWQVLSEALQAAGDTAGAEKAAKRAGELLQ